MADYARANSGGSTHFGDKDALSSGDADKVIVGSQFDTEFNAIVTAVASKLDSGDVASQAQAEGLTLNTVLITPHNLNDVLVDNAGMAKDIQQLTDPGADRILFWDNSASAATFLSVGTGLSLSGTSLTTNDSEIEVNNDNWSGTDLAVANGGTGASSASAARSALGLVIGTHVQAFDSVLTTLAGLDDADGNFIVGNGSAWTVESGATARNSLSLGTSNTPQFTGINIGHASDSTLTRDGAGQLAIEGRAVFVQEDASLTSSKIFIETGDPDDGTDGNDGDIWLKYEV